jgi:hypothetical protein
MEVQSMRSVRRFRVALTLVSALALLGGCGPSDSQAESPADASSGATDQAGTQTPTSPASSASESSAPPETTGTGPSNPDIPIPDLPHGAPRTPTDLVPSNILVGTIRSGEASCYTMETDENQSYALLGAQGHSLAAGVMVRVTIADDRPATAPCPGNPVSVVSLERV